MLLETERWEMDAVAEYPSLGQDTDTADTVNLHLHVGVAVGVSEICQMRPPGGVLGIALHNDGVFVECISQR